jgi:integrase
VGRVAASPLTAKQAQHESRPGYYADGPNTGLYLQVKAGKSGTTRSWIYRYTSPVTRKRREIGLGSVRSRKIADARLLAMDYRLQVLNGNDPKDERDSAHLKKVASHAKQVTFDEACMKCIQAKEPEWKNVKHGQQWRNTLKTYVSPLLGKLPVSSITTDLIYEVLEPIWLNKTETATRVRQRIEVVLDWSTARGYRKGENPARLKGPLGALLPKSNRISKIVHHPAIPYSQIQPFVHSLRDRGGIGAFALEFLLLTAARTNEGTKAKWEEFDVDAKTWTIPAERMKVGKEHRVPLSKRAIKILEIMRAGQQSQYVFPSPSVTKNTHISLGTCLSLMKRMEGYSNYTPHGLRSTFRDWAAETTKFSNETLEIALAHTIKNKAEAAYRRGDQLAKRAKLMEQWSVFVGTELKGDNVSSIGVKQASR